MRNKSEDWRNGGLADLGNDQLVEELRAADSRANVYSSCTDGSFECAREMEGFNALADECTRRDIHWRELLGYIKVHK